MLVWYDEGIFSLENRKVFVAKEERCLGCPGGLTTSQCEKVLLQGGGEHVSTNYSLEAVSLMKTVVTK